MRKRALSFLLCAAVLTVASVVAANATAGSTEARGSTVTPIQHVVVIFQENVSYDHYFGTYPNAANTDGQHFTAAPGTPSGNGLSSLRLRSTGCSWPTG